MLGQPAIEDSLPIAAAVSDGLNEGLSAAGDQASPSSSQSAADPEAPATVVAPLAPTRKRPPAWLWIAIAAVVATLVLGGGGTALAFSLYGQPVAAATQFCQDLKTQNYDSAYARLSARLRGEYAIAQFRVATTGLDSAEGKVIGCAQAPGANAYRYRLGSSTAAFTAVITREKQGALRGALHLARESGGWKVAGLDTALLGINLDALGVLDAFCADMQTQAYANAYALFDGALQGQSPQANFVQESQWRDQIDGTITSCALSGVAAGATDAASHVTASLTRAKLGARTGALSLAANGGAWRIIGFDDTLNGSPVAPVRVGIRFCAAISAAQWAAAYALLADDIQQQISLAQLPGYFTLPNGLQNAGCTPDLATYTLQSRVVFYTSALKIVDPVDGASEAITMTLFFTGSGEDWQVDGWTFG